MCFLAVTSLGLTRIELERISAEGRRAETKIYNSVALYERALSLKIDVTSDAQSLENGGQLSQSATGMSQSCKTIFFRFSNINPKHLDQEFVVSIRRDEKTGNRFRGRCFMQRFCIPWQRNAHERVSDSGYFCFDHVKLGCSLLICVCLGVQIILCSLKQIHVHRM